MNKHSLSPVPPASSALLDTFAGDPSFMLSLARGMLVLRTFAEQRRKLSVAEIATQTGLSRSTVGRCMHTFVHLGYFEKQGSQFAPRVSLMMLASVFPGAGGLEAALQPLLDDLRDRLRITVALGVKDGSDIYYTVVSKSSSTLSLVAFVGRRLPAYCSAIGRVFLASLSDSELQAYLEQLSPVPYTPHSTVKIADLERRIAEVREQDFAVADQELDLGVRAVSVPVRSRDDKVVAAILVGGQMARLGDDVVVDLLLPEVRKTAREIGLIWDNL